MCANEHNCKNTGNILCFLFSFFLLTSQWLTAVIFQLGSDIPESAGSLLSATPDSLGHCVLLLLGHGDNFLTGNLLSRCGAKKNNTRLINCIDYYISRGNTKIRAITSYRIFFIISNQKMPSWFSEGLYVDAFLVALERADSFQHFSKHCFESL